MLTSENRYDFREKLSEVHKKGVRGDISFDLLPRENLTSAERMECTAEVGDGVKMSACHERGLAQWLYKLEYLMDTRKAPFLKKGAARHTAVPKPFLR